MKAILYDAFGATPRLTRVADPAPEPDGVVLEVGATGICRSDWHGWVGHDPGIRLPHVPGHEFAGTVRAVGNAVRRWREGDRVTVPFVAACGNCPQCHSGNQQVCDRQFQPGFTHWGSFAECVAVSRADLNLVALPPALDFATAASLGCRFATSFRAVVDQGRLSPSQWLAVFGCGGVGLSAVNIGAAVGARVIAVDIAEDKLSLAHALGAAHVLNARTIADVASAIRDLTQGGAHLSLDALGSPSTCADAICSLRKRGRHVQVGLLLGEHSSPALPMDRVIANELEILGSHGMQAHRYESMLGMIAAGLLRPQALIGQRIRLDQSIDVLMRMDRFENTGVTIITEF